MSVCKVFGCGRPARARQLCATHYERFLIRKHEWRGKRSDEPIRPYFVDHDKRSCVCETPVVGVIALFTRTYREREPRPGDMVECRECGMPIEEWLDHAVLR